jgi:hypothetical protein
MSQKRNKARRQQVDLKHLEHLLRYDPNEPATARVWSERFLAGASAGLHADLEAQLAGVPDPGGIIRGNMVSKGRIRFLAAKQRKGLLLADPEVSDPTDWVKAEQVIA